MKVILFGGTGFIGRHVSRHLHESGYEVWIASRKDQHVDYGRCFSYRPSEIADVLAGIKSPYAIVNLAGESIQSGRWTDARKKKILHSRVDLTQAIVSATMKVSMKPRVFVNASAVGFYGSSRTATFTEEAEAGKGFLATVTREWENAAKRASDVTRVVLARLGVVLGRDGGAFPRMIAPYHFFLGGRVGDGSQWISWIHIDDVVCVLERCITDERIAGPVNLTAPQPVRMDEFGRTIAKIMRRPHWLPVPESFLRLLLGEMSEIVLEGQKVLPEKLRTLGYSFQHDSLEKAVRHLLAKKA
jgi:uncharacterized protein